MNLLLCNLNKFYDLYFYDLVFHYCTEKCPLHQKIDIYYKWYYWNLKFLNFTNLSMKFEIFYTIKIESFQIFSLIFATLKIPIFVFFILL